MKKPILLVLFVFFLLSLNQSCCNGCDDDGPPPPPVNPTGMDDDDPVDPGDETNPSEGDLIVYLGSSNPLLFSTLTESNETLEVYGIRNGSGLPTSINQILLRNNNDAETVYLLDDSGKLNYIKAYDGTVLKLDWQEDLIELTVIGASKENFFKTTVDLNQPEGKVSFENGYSSDIQNEWFEKNQNESDNIRLNVLRCGELADYEGVVKIETDFGAYDVTNKFSVLRKTNIGVFQGQINNPLLPPIGQQEICSVIEPLAENLCAVYDTNPDAALVIGNTICTQIGAYISLTGAVPVGIGVGGLCIALNGFFAITCSIIPESISQVCNDANFQDLSFTNQELPIRAVLSGPDGNYTGDWITVNFSQPLPPLEINLGDDYSHLVEINAPLLDCESGWEAYVDDINLGLISNDFPVYTSIPSGDHLVYLKNGIVFTENWDQPVSLPCEKLEDVYSINFDEECEEENNEVDLNHLFSGSTWIFQNPDNGSKFFPGTSTSYDRDTEQIENINTYSGEEGNGLLVFSPIEFPLPQYTDPRIKIPSFGQNYWGTHTFKENEITIVFQTNEAEKVLESTFVGTKIKNKNVFKGRIYIRMTTYVKKIPLNGELIKSYENLIDAECEMILQ